MRHRDVARASIVVDGVVQGVGYRALVKLAAGQLGLTGLVRNLEDTRVQVHCEGPRPKIEEFLGKIRVRGRPGDFTSINVTDVKCHWEGEEGYQPAWKPHRGFEIDYGDEKLTTLEKTNLEDHEFAKLYFIGFRDEQRSFAEELRGFRGEQKEAMKALREEQREGFSGLREEQRGLREETNKNFGQMAERYGDISEELRAFREAFEKVVAQFLREYEVRRKEK